MQVYEKKTQVTLSVTNSFTVSAMVKSRMKDTVFVVEFCDEFLNLLASLPLCWRAGTEEKSQSKMCVER